MSLIKQPLTTARTLGVAFVAALSLGACATQEDIDAVNLRIDQLDSRVQSAAQTAESANQSAQRANQRLDQLEGRVQQLEIATRSCAPRLAARPSF